MSFSNSKEETNPIDNFISNPTDGFEKHIIQCCKAPEWELRRWLRKVLSRAGFTIYEDGYLSERVAKDKRLATVHNMLAVRGNAPNICLAAHTDVCRDHEELRSDSMFGQYGEHHHWMYNRHEVDEEKKAYVPRKVDPVIKTAEIEGKIRRVIQDRECKLQVGGDDRLGVAINTWIALNSGFDMGLLFLTDEEIGLKSARACEMEMLKSFDMVVQTDRGNHSDELVIKISNEILCSYDSAVNMLEIAYDLGMPRSVVTGMSTDIFALKARGMVKEAVNLTVGYHNSHGAGTNEYIDIQEAKDTMKYVAHIVKDYYLKQSASIENNICEPKVSTTESGEIAEVEIDISQ